MTYGFPCWADDVLDALAPAVAAGVPGLTPDRVFESLADDDAHLDSPPAGDFAVIGLRGLTPRTGPVTGGGRLTTLMDLRAAVTLYARIGDDQQLRDRRTLRDRSRSLLARGLRLVQALQMWRPLTADKTACLLAEPGRLAGGLEFRGRRQGQGAASWSLCSSVWQFTFLASLDTPPGA